VPLDLAGLRVHAVGGALRCEHVEEATDLLLYYVALLHRRRTLGRTPGNFEVLRAAHRDHSVLVFHALIPLRWVA